MARFDYFDYAERLQHYLITRLPLNASIAILGHNLCSCWEFTIRLRTNRIRSHEIHFSVAASAYLNGSRCEANIAEDASHIAHLLRIHLGLDLPNADNAFERLLKPKPVRDQPRTDCRFYSGIAALKCAVNPALPCCECGSFEPR